MEILPASAPAPTEAGDSVVLDTFFLRLLNGLAGEFVSVDWVTRLVAADHVIPLASALSLLWLWLAGKNESERSRWQRGALVGLVALVVASGVASILALVVDRARPFVELGGIELLYYRPTDPSFPAHPVAVVVAAGAGAAMGNRRLGRWIISGGIAVGVARIVAGVHWPSDVIVGIALGLISAHTVKIVLSRTEPIPTLMTRLLLGSPSVHTGRCRMAERYPQKRPNE